VYNRAVRNFFFISAALVVSLVIGPNVGAQQSPGSAPPINCWSSALGEHTFR